MCSRLIFIIRVHIYSELCYKHIHLVFNVHATIYVNTCLKYCFHFVIFAYNICIIKLPVCALYDLDSLETNFYIVKLRFTGVFIRF